jgi:tight adherence protein B
VRLPTAGATGAVLLLALLPTSATAQAVQGVPPPAELYDAGALGTTTVLYAAAGLGFLALLLFLVVLLVPRGDRRASRTLRRGLTMAQTAGDRQGTSDGRMPSELGQRFIDLVASIPRPSGYDERLAAELDRAGWQLRAKEFTAARLAIGLAGLVLFWALSGRFLLGLVVAVAAGYAPGVVLSSSKRRRQKKFLEQLPDTLQLLSGTLKAGYGALQGINTVVKETEDPIAAEFQRVLTEARLGLPLEDSLEAMADRMESDDFRWIVVAMNIQRQVGGNLAELLETVSETLRGREQVRRQVQVLSAEGRLSAVVLVGLPFVLLAYMLLVNPVYIMQLFVHPVGLMMSAAGVGLLGFGIVWMRRLVHIDV